MKSTKTYKKSDKQTRKERSRRRKLREIALKTLDSGHWPTQQWLAEQLGCSQPTVSRDLAVLARSRWNPYQIDMARTWREIQEKTRKMREEAELQVSNMSDAELIKAVFHQPRKKGKPRGKPFSSSYQPRKKIEVSDQYIMEHREQFHPSLVAAVEETRRLEIEMSIRQIERELAAEREARLKISGR